jgi:hypothetical protein
MVAAQTIGLPIFQSSTLSKGSMISAEQIEQTTGTSRRVDYRRFQFAKLAIQEQIEREREDLIVSSDGEGLAVLTDEQAHEHLASLIRRYERGIRKSGRKRARIVRDQFSDALRQAAEVEDRRTAGAILALRRNARAHARMQKI